MNARPAPCRQHRCGAETGSQSSLQKPRRSRIPSPAVADLKAHTGLCLGFALKFGPSGQKRTHVSMSSFGFGLSRVWSSSPEAACVCPDITGRKRGPRGAMALPTFHMTASPRPHRLLLRPGVRGPTGRCGSRCTSWEGGASPRAAGALLVPWERLRPEPSPSSALTNQPRSRSRGGAWPRPPGRGSRARSGVRVARAQACAPRPPPAASWPLTSSSPMAHCCGCHLQEEQEDLRSRGQVGLCLELVGAGAPSRRSLVSNPACVTMGKVHAVTQVK